MSRPRKPSPAKGPPLTWDSFKALARTYPEVEEGLSWGTPGLKVRGKMLARLREDGETIVIRIDMDQRAVMIEANPEAFFFTDHYANYPAMLIRLVAAREGDVVDLIEDAWRNLATKKAIAQFDAGK